MKQTYFKDIGVGQSYWRIVKEQIIRIRGKKCEHCGSTKRLCLHHKKYDSQTIDGFELICFKCHMKLHRKDIVRTK